MKHARNIAILTILIVAVFGNSLHGAFVFDDLGIIRTRRCRA